MILHIQQKAIWINTKLFRLSTINKNKAIKEDSEQFNQRIQNCNSKTYSTHGKFSHENFFSPFYFHPFHNDYQCMGVNSNLDKVYISKVREYFKPICEIKTENQILK